MSPAALSISFHDREFLGKESAVVMDLKHEESTKRTSIVAVIGAEAHLE